MALALVGANECTLSIRGITGSCDHFMQINPVNNFAFLYTPNSNLFIQGTTNEVFIINRIELDASHIVTVGEGFQTVSA
jgi:hypothetical protein